MIQGNKHPSEIQSSAFKYIKGNTVEKDRIHVFKIGWSALTYEPTHWPVGWEITVL